MAITTRYRWPTPNLSDAPDVPGDMSTLANAVEETLGNMDDRLTSLTGLSQSIFQYTTLTRTSSTIPEIPSTVWTPVPFDTAMYNLPKATPGFVQASPTRITILQTGLYRMSGFAGFAINTQGSRGVCLRINNGVRYAAVTTGVPPADIEWYGTVYVESRMNKDDYVELCMRHTSSGRLKMDTVRPTFSVQRLV